MSAPFTVKAEGGDYPIYVGFDLLTQPSLFASLLTNKRVIILSHPVIAQHYLATLTHTCEKANARSVATFLVPAGEKNKTLTTAEQVWSYLLTHHYHRDTLCIALGGGMIGDVTGFIAACFMRGVPFIQCPTSLLAQIDAAIGGKTGVNHPLGKNMLGAFYAPKMVVSDLATLATLPEREYIAGLAELIKYGIALDARLFAWLEKNMAALLKREPVAMQFAVESASKIKAEIVSADEKEQGSRVLLNFGHTVAHALENLLNYDLLLHGEAVALGMVVATHLALGLDWVKAEVLSRLIALLTQAKLPLVLPKGITVAEILSKIKQDKKHTQQTLQWVLLKNVGDAHTCSEVLPEHLRAALLKCGAS